ncbi:myotubularin-related protein 10-B-like [Agrilus planipennis]|uniref:Myotubularin-related protein 10-B-like n=1 Tax=Agrilus planipennis TaxID=224129 RepID=A0A7F5QXG2_AGRPL|nr:myotubularin-related protein 10-B-like [Agrilus planipennis]
MNDIKNTGFTSYLDESELESVTLSDLQKTKLLDGETLVAEAQKVLLFAPLSDHKRGTLGILTVTTFKLAFACANEDDYESSYQQNMLLGPYEVCLSSIDTIYQVGDKSKKKLIPGQNVSGKIKELLIICKNMRTFEFSFKDSDKDSGRTIANSLLHHAFPKRHSLLFAYEYAEPYFKSGKDVRTFRKPEDWRLEMERTRCQLWRISLLNQNFVVSPTLCEAFVVPSSVTDSGLTKAVEHFRNRSCPVWVWSAPSGAALVRMSDILPTITDRTQENVMLEHVRKSHAEKRQPHIMDLSRECPTPKEVQSSYMKLRDLCAPENIKTFKIQDYKFCGLLENTKWLQHVSTCLTKAAEGADLICNPEPTTVVLQEYSGQDMNCVVSSLIQLLLDSNWRTVYGFQTLIQKEWVALGHPFTYRLGHILNPDIEAAPLFLLFLDCVWQLLQQFPTAFQFTETYLTTLWDSAHVTVFDTFLFNCEHDRSIARTVSDFYLLLSLSRASD